ncbi:MAG: phospholipid carrier-dependent glycosyltransferase [Verrucomicrobia bacterium]|nr:phospholipid carrier-dependent glycosyltransferase [Verrucomicrobiota bacterium]
MSNDKSKARDISKDVALLTLGLGLIYFSMIGLRPFSNPDEGRYAEIPREMVASGDWVTPRLNGVLYFEKPPFFYWLEALALKAGGMHEATLRFWPAALGILGCLTIYATGRRLYGRTAGIFSAIVLGTSLLFFGLSQIILLDMAVSVFISGALCCFILGVREPPGPTRRRLLSGFYLCMAVATLTKGLIGLAIPGAIIFLWTLLLWRWKSIFPLYLWIGIPLFLLVAVPWHVLAALATPAREHSAGFFSTKEEGQGFLWYYFMRQQVLRYLTAVDRREEPIWFFLVVLPAGLFPWVAFLPQAIKQSLQGGWKKRHEQPEVYFFIIWIAFVLLFFSTSQSKLIPYILPVYPALALLVGRYLSAAWGDPGRVSLKAGYVGYAIIAALLAAATPFILRSRPDTIRPAALPWFGVLIGILAISAILVFRFSRRRTSPRGLVVLMLAAAGICLVFNPLAAALHRPSARELCKFLKPRLAPDTLVFNLREYCQDVPPYLERLIGVVSFEPDEQRFGLQLESHSDRYVNAHQFVELWQGNQRVYALTSWRHYRAFAAMNPSWRPIEIMKDDDFVLLSNQPDAYNPQPVKP